MALCHNPGVADALSRLLLLAVCAAAAPRPAEDSPYLLMGDGVDTLDTALGVDDDEEEDR